MSASGPTTDGVDFSPAGFRTGFVRALPVALGVGALALLRGGLPVA
jgi:hypothetical protein